MAAAVGSLGLHPRLPGRGCVSDGFVVIFLEKAKASEGLASSGVCLRKNIFQGGISQFEKILSLAIAHFVFNFSLSSLFIKSERKINFEIFLLGFLGVWVSF